MKTIVSRRSIELFSNGRDRKLADDLLASARQVTDHLLEVDHGKFREFMATKISAPSGGPGTELKGMLAMFGIQASPGCSCTQMAAQMDSWGPDKCKENAGEIVSWLGKEAKRRRLPFSEMAARILVLRAIKAARKKQPVPAQS